MEPFVIEVQNRSTDAFAVVTAVITGASAVVAAWLQVRASARREAIESTALLANRAPSAGAKRRWYTRFVSLLSVVPLALGAAMSGTFWAHERRTVSGLIEDAEYYLATTGDLIDRFEGTPDTAFDDAPTFRGMWDATRLFAAHQTERQLLIAIRASQGRLRAYSLATVLFLALMFYFIANSKNHET